MQLSNYLFFTTACEEALAFYTSCGLGEVTELRRHGDDGMPVAVAAMEGRVLHARFEGPACCSMRPTTLMPNRCAGRPTC